jgi:DNA-binding CsgD family transcriptional regulator
MAIDGPRCSDGVTGGTVRGVTQSTPVGRAGRQPVKAPRRGPGPGRRPQLRTFDYERAFDVLARCDRSPSVSEFKDQVAQGLIDAFGVRHVSVFAGATFHNVFGDASPLTEGHTSRMLPEYQERWCRYDIFGTPVAMRQLVGSGVASLVELETTGALPVSAEAYVRHFLHATWGMESATAVRLELPGGHTALIGLFDPERDKIGSAELATLRLLSRQLSAVCRHLPVTAARAGLVGLSARQRQVVELIAEGLSNAEIAQTLSLAEDSVKKYVSRILGLTGCQSRMELALLARSVR